ncbi:MAG: nitrous oxide reductase family maturation protein NosD [Candidatus Hodarchaeota archaeon]
MRRYIEIRIIILLILGISFALIPLITTNLCYITVNSTKRLDYSDDFPLDKSNLKISAISGKIHVDNNWTATKSVGICTGSGTYSDPYVIEDLIIDGGGSGSCILIENSNVYFRIENCTLYNSGGYIGPIEAGISLKYVNNSILVNNNCSSIYLYRSDINNISGNSVNTYPGITLIGSDNNIISGNIAEKADLSSGISLQGSDNNIITGNNVSEFFNDGISLSESRNNTISGNAISNNNDCGIILSGSQNNIISGNDINNNERGIILDVSAPPGIPPIQSDYNIIVGNNITNNSQNGVGVSGNYNFLYNNTFIGNLVHAIDNGMSTQWDDGSLGNYWDNYTGSDVNDDGIGDIPYDVPPAGGSMDNYPIWDDGDDAAPPIIEIISPITDQVFGTNAPSFQIDKITLYINSTWYTIDGSITNYTFSGLIGTVNQSAWDDKANEMVTLTIYANNSVGLIGSDYVVIVKDIIAPKITINVPTSNQLCGITAPSFSLTIDEPHIQTKLYSLNGRPNITFTSETQFSQSEWDNIANGTVSIMFYVIDSAGNINSSEAIVRKDAFTPVITIHSPLPNELFGSMTPEFNISIIEEDLDSTWYTLEGVAGTFTFTSLTGSINQDAWNDAPSGELTITFNALDSAGNIGTESVVVRKNIPSRPGIHGYNLFFLIGAISIVIIIIKRVKIK